MVWARGGMYGRRAAFSSECGNSWWNSTSERPSIIRHLSIQVYGDRGKPPSHPWLHNLVSCQTVAMMKPKHHQSAVTPRARLQLVTVFQGWRFPGSFHTSFRGDSSAVFVSQPPCHALCLRVLHGCFPSIGCVYCIFSISRLLASQRESFSVLLLMLHSRQQQLLLLSW